MYWIGMHHLKAPNQNRQQWSSIIQKARRPSLLTLLD